MDDRRQIVVHTPVSISNLDPFRWAAAILRHLVSQCGVIGCSMMMTMVFRFTNGEIDMKIDLILKIPTVSTIFIKYEMDIEMSFKL
ncbi:hypothetical protein T4D_15462 [Trichinella pseudospiralis]|uniref:Uncharacterized protein n=1 Tax=Trichinella pseudospiralis TaxID=6337 RepID=A0A0V1FVK7_TRIPS|nr:hypothetical protein T4D_15462 [Trichinella pseudospiralis]